MPAVADYLLRPERAFLARKGVLGSKGHSWLERAFIEHHIDDGLRQTAVGVPRVFCLAISPDDVCNEPV